MHKLRDIDLNLFVVLDALLRLRSVSKAAQTLGVSQRSVSQPLKRLREHFGDPLFLKVQQGVAPTDKALSLAEDAARFVAFAEAAMVGQGRFDPSTARSTVVLGINDMAEVGLAAPLLERFSVLAPGCRLHTVDARGEELKAGLASGDIDLTVTGAYKPQGDVLQQKLFDHLFVVVTGAASDLNDEIDLATFAALPQIVVTPTSDNAAIEAVLARQGVERWAALCTPHWLAVPHILQRLPNYIAVTPLQLADLYAPFGLKTLRASFDLPKIEIHQFWHRRANADNFNIWLRGLVRDVFFRHPELHITTS